MNIDEFEKLQKGEEVILLANYKLSNGKTDIVGAKATVEGITTRAQKRADLKKLGDIVRVGNVDMPSGGFICDGATIFYSQKSKSCIACRFIRAQQSGNNTNLLEVHFPRTGRNC